MERSEIEYKLYDIRSRFDERQRIRSDADDKDKGKWITANGTHIHIGENGEVDKGPANLRKHINSGKTTQSSSGSATSKKSGKAKPADVDDFIDPDQKAMEKAMEREHQKQAKRLLDPGVGSYAKKAEGNNTQDGDYRFGGMNSTGDYMSKKRPQRRKMLETAKPGTCIMYETEKGNLEPKYVKGESGRWSRYGTTTEHLESNDLLDFFNSDRRSGIVNAHVVEGYKPTVKAVDTTNAAAIKKQLEAAKPGTILRTRRNTPNFLSYNYTQKNENGEWVQTYGKNNSENTAINLAYLMGKNIDKVDLLEI